MYNQLPNKPRKIILAAVGNLKTDEIKTIDPCDRYQSLPGNGEFLFRQIKLVKLKN